MLALSPRSLPCSQWAYLAVSGGPSPLSVCSDSCWHRRVRREFIPLERVGTSALSCWFVCSPYWCYSPVFFCNSLRQANGPQGELAFLLKTSQSNTLRECVILLLRRLTSFKLIIPHAGFIMLKCIQAFPNFSSHFRSPHISWCFLLGHLKERQPHLYPHLAFIFIYIYYIFPPPEEKGEGFPFIQIQKYCMCIASRIFNN